MWHEWRDKPWYPGRATCVVLYPAGDRWRFAIVPQKGGFIDGRLPALGMSPDEAKTVMLDHLAETDEVKIDGEWRSAKPGWWEADLVPAESEPDAKTGMA